MAVNAKYLGSWELDTTRFEGVEEFAKATGALLEAFKKELSIPHIATTSIDGDKYKIHVDFKGAVPNVTNVMGQGEEIDYAFPNGATAKVTLKFDADGSPIESYRIPEINVHWTVTRSLEGNVMTVESTLGEAVMKLYYNKV